MSHTAAVRIPDDQSANDRADSRRSGLVQAPANFEPVLNTEEAAALLQIHPKTLQRMARQGRVPAFRIGDLWRFRASALDEWLRSRVCSNRHSCRI
jgi:excisionase family DNA binding protein